jgi:hypothetical protein
VLRGPGFWIIVAVLAIFGLALLWTYLVEGEASSQYSYSQLLADAAGGKVETVVQEGTQLTVTLRGAAEPRVVTIAPEAINVYAEVCAAAGAPLHGRA